MLLQDGNVFQGLAIDNYTVRIVTLFDLIHFMRTYEHLRTAVCRRYSSFVWWEAKSLDKVGEIPGTGSMRRPRKAIITARSQQSSRNASRAGLTVSGERQSLGAPLASPG